MEIPNKPFAIYAYCSVIYSGRAESTLELGNYLILWKNDRSVSVHGGNQIGAKNYMGKNSEMTVRGHCIIFKLKKEKIIIAISKIISITPLIYWSEEDVQMSKTEKDLARKLLYNWYDYFNVDFEIIYTEVETSLGIVDLLGLEADNTHHIVELKRDKSTLSSVSQLGRYVEYYTELGVPVVGYVASPKISKNAEGYLKKHDWNWIRINFD